MSVQYAYDGSFPGVLCALCASLGEKERPFGIVSEREFQPALLAPTVPVTTDDDRAGRFMERITTVMGRHVRRTLVRAFLSDLPGRELRLYDYLAFLRDRGPRGDACLTHPSVAPVRDLARQVTVEAHRLTGLARFARVDEGLLLALMEPRHLILPLIAPHFIRRFPAESSQEEDIPRTELVPLRDEEKRTLLRIARQALEATLVRGKRLDIPQDSPGLHQVRAAFVTLWRRDTGDLRGCRGECIPRRPLAEAVARMAVASALDDPRFPSVTAEEIPLLRIDINALTPLRPIRPEDVEVGRHGLMIVRSPYAGLLL
ncbi:MAG TPA: TIGR03915 family putative DNA repair protein, partial [bacterium]|nr:TIGR03915 family putative DNA repair protein [bacterium]